MPGTADGTCRCAWCGTPTREYLCAPEKAPHRRVFVFDCAQCKRASVAAPVLIIDKPCRFAVATHKADKRLLALVIVAKSRTGTLRDEDLLRCRV